MTKKDLLKRLAKYDDDTMLLFGEYIKEKETFGWDNIYLLDNGEIGKLYICTSGEVEYGHPNELKPMLVGC